MVDAPRPDNEQPSAASGDPGAASGRHARHAIMPVRVNVAADGTMSAVNTRGGELPIGTGWDGQGSNPIEMLLAAIGGCAAIDFTTVLKRRGHPLSGLEIEVRGRRADDERLEAIEVFYALPKDAEVSDEDIEVARRLTADVLCTVSRTVQHSSPVEYIVVDQLPTDQGEAELEIGVEKR
jgi:putative redox protein